MFKFPSRFLFVLTIATLMAHSVLGQNLYSVNGTVKKDKKRLEGAIVTLYKGTSQVQQVITNSSGRFSVKLDLNAEYTLTITKASHITKKFYFNTKGVPDERAKEEFGGQDIEVSIFEMPKDPNIVSQINSILTQPMAKFYYDDNLKEIDFDKAYSQSMLDALAKLNQIEKEANEKAEEEAKKNAQMESVAASKYEAAIAKGDAAFGKKDYVTARAAYTDALSIKPAEAYPKGKIVEIEKLLADAAKNAQIEADYKAAIGKADAAFSEKKYDVAKGYYGDALKLKPAETYPKSQLDMIAKLLADAAKNEALNAKYNEAIAKGDKALGAKSYDAAKAAYNEALGLKPGEKYPKDKLAEIDKALADAAAKDAADKALNAKYQAAIAKGDAAFAKKDYTTATAGYTEATGLKPAEQYPKDKLAEIGKAIADAASKDAEAKALNAKYTAAIAKGDAAMAKKDYVTAKSGYGEATGLKPAEQYPKDKLAEIEKILADTAAKDAAEKDRLAKEKALNDKYNAAIAKGDAALAKKDYATAKSGYTEATGLKPGEQYPKDKLAEIEKALSDAASKDAAEKALIDKYNAAIAKGDAAFAKKDYATAKSGYTEASGLKPAEKYPKDKIAEIDAIIAKELGAKELDAKYAAAIAKGDAALKLKSYTDAKAGYTEALGYKPNEAYPKTKLEEIEKALAAANAKEQADKDRLAKEKELAEKYAAAVVKADAAFGTKDYTTSLAAYNEALIYKNTERYPKDKIEEINAILAKEMGAKELEKKYADAIAKGDQAFNSKDYANAKTQYTTASGLKPAEQYPKDKLAEIQKILDEIAASKNKDAAEKALNAKYAAAIAKGDAAMKLKTYASAKTAYTEASGIKPDEQYPKDKLSEIDKLMNDANAEKDRAAVEAKYKAAIAKGDAALKLKSYEAAKGSYTDALTIKPGEQYPKDKISEIDKLLADLANKNNSAKELNDKYNAAIAKGDAALAAKNYDEAKSGYNAALGLKPAEKYPKDKLAAIDALLAKEAGAKEQEEKFKALITKADEAYAAKDYMAAKTAYTDASTLKPTEQYPKDQLVRVNGFLADIAKEKATQGKYEAAISKADAALGAKNYPLALSSYKEAQTLKPDEPYPGNKIGEINKTMDDLARQKEKDKQYDDIIVKADKLFATKDYKAAKGSYLDASLVKPTEKYPKDQVAVCDGFLKKKGPATTAPPPNDKNDFKNDLAKKYPEGITEESVTENNAKVTRRIVVKGDEGHMYVKKVTSFGPVYFFKDNIPITENEYLKDTEVQ